MAFVPHDITADPLALAIAKGFRWQALLDTGMYPTVRALAKAVKQDTAYVARTIRLTLLAPEIIEAVMAAILDHLQAIGQRNCVFYCYEAMLDEHIPVLASHRK